METHFTNVKICICYLCISFVLILNKKFNKNYYSFRESLVEIWSTTQYQRHKDSPSLELLDKFKDLKSDLAIGVKVTG